MLCHFLKSKNDVFPQKFYPLIGVGRMHIYMGFSFLFSLSQQRNQDKFDNSEPSACALVTSDLAFGRNLHYNLYYLKSLKLLKLNPQSLFRKEYNFMSQ